MMSESKTECPVREHRRVMRGVMPVLVAILALLSALPAQADPAEICESYLWVPQQRLDRETAREIRKTYLDVPFFPRSQLGAAVRCYVSVLEALRPDVTLRCARGDFDDLEAEAAYEEKLSQGAAYCLARALQEANR